LLALGCDEPAQTAGPGRDSSPPLPAAVAPPAPAAPRPGKPGDRTDDLATPKEADFLPDAPVEGETMEVKPPVRPEFDPDIPMVDHSERELTTDQAVRALEQIGARLGRDDNGNVVKVFLNRTLITDTQLWPIKYLPTVEIINFTATSISDAGLEHFKELPHLKRIYPARSKTTEAGREQLKQALPELQIAL